MTIRLRLAPLIWTLALAACGAPGQPSDNAATDSEDDMAGFTLTSDAFEDGATIPTQYTCDGEDLSPALSWSDPPSGTRSFTLIMDDPDAPSGTYSHWAAFDIDRETGSLEIGAGRAGGGAGAFRQGRNDFGNAGYGGPCPPPGHGPHRYYFKLYALDVRQLTEVDENASVKEVEQAAQQHRIEVAQLMGRYERR